MRPLLLALVLLAPVVASAQTPDTLDARGYFPLAVGNEWEYGLYLYRPASIYRPQNETRTEYVRLRVVSEAAGPEADRFALVDERYSDQSVLLRRDTVAVRFDPATTSVLGLFVGTEGNAYEEPFPFFACDLGIPFNSTGTCWGATEAEVSLPALTGSAAPVAAKQFANSVYSFTAVHGLGFVGGGGGCEPCSSFSDYDEWTLAYARIDGQTYGTEIVAGEAGPVAGGPSLRVSPNPADAEASVAVGPLGAGAARLAVFDALGREVAAFDVAAGERTVRLDTAAWPPGVYVVRAEAGGRVSSARLVVAR